MKRYINYLLTVIKHKYFVFWACVKMRVPLRLAIWHDMSKFSIIEFMPYAKQFFNGDGTKRDVRDATGSYDPNLQSPDFVLAWNNHQKNKHHWQAWISLGDGGSMTPIEMPMIYVREMIADWIGAGMAYNGKANPLLWYEKIKNKMILHPHTIIDIEFYLLQLSGGDAEG